MVHILSWIFTIFRKKYSCAADEPPTIIGCLLVESLGLILLFDLLSDEVRDHNEQNKTCGLWGRPWMLYTAWIPLKGSSVFVCYCDYRIWHSMLGK